MNEKKNSKTHNEFACFQFFKILFFSLCAKKKTKFLFYSWNHYCHHHHYHYISNIIFKARKKIINKEIIIISYGNYSMLYNGKKSGQIHCLFHSLSLIICFNVKEKKLTIVMMLITSTFLSYYFYFKIIIKLVE